MKFALTLAVLMCLTATRPASADEIAGLWMYESFDRPAYGVQPLVGLFLFNEGRFVHQAMHGSEPMEEQLTDAHIGRYRFKSGDIVQFDVDTGIVVTPAGESPPVGALKYQPRRRLQSVWGEPLTELRQRRHRKAGQGPQHQGRTHRPGTRGRWP